jgi:hyperpolarization activated cyclic nucleotide-gated potassium channel 2
MALTYAKSWLILDLASSVPLDWFLRGGLQFSEPEEATQSTSALDLSVLFRIVKLIKLLRLLRLARLVRVLNKLAEKSILFSSGVQRLIKLVFFIFLFTHWNGCIQFLISSILGFPSDSWVVRAGIRDVSGIEQWSWSFFAAFCQMLTIAMGIVPPSRVSEVWMYFISMTIGAGLYAVLVASLTSGKPTPHIKVHTTSSAHHYSPS